MMEEPHLFDPGPPVEHFVDVDTMAPQLAAVYYAVEDGAWHTLAQVATVAQVPEASASARLRDLRQRGHNVERRRQGKDQPVEYRFRP